MVEIQPKIGIEVGGIASAETLSLSLQHGARLVPGPGVPVEVVLLAVGEVIGHDHKRVQKFGHHDNIVSAARLDLHFTEPQTNTQ